MTMPDWAAIRLVVFDLDGTLYDQRRVRAAMAVRLLWATLLTRDPNLTRTLRIFRICREELGDAQSPDFLDLQYSLCAERSGRSIEDVRNLTAEWMERRPLALLRKARATAVTRFFQALSATGRTIAILSDYPVHDKLAALELSADIVVSATDSDVARLKPDPAGLNKILRLSGSAPSSTLMIGDRFDRDWQVARRAGVDAVIRSRRPDVRCPTFQAYDEPLFQPVLREAAACA